MRRTTLLLALCIAALSTSVLEARTAAAQSTIARHADTLATFEIRRQLNLLRASSSMYAVHPASGRTVDVRGDVPMNSMSTIKIAIMLLAYRDVEAGQLSLDTRVTLRAEDRREGSGLLRRLDPGASLTVRDLIDQMIITSDNTATQALIARLQMARINAMLRELNFQETRLVQTITQFFDGLRPARGSPDRNAMRTYATDSATWLGRTTAREMTTLLEGIYTAKFASRASSTAMMNHLFAQFYNSRLPATLRNRAGVRIAHKTGDFPPFSGSDVGVIEYPGGPLFISVFTNANDGDFAALEYTIGRVAELLVNRW